MDRAARGHANAADVTNDSPFPLGRGGMTTAAPSPVSLLIATHGIEGGPGVAACHADRIAARGLFRTVAVGCLRGEPTLAQALARLPGPVVVVPLLFARGWIFDRVCERLSTSGRDDLWLAPPVGTLAGAGELLARMTAAGLRRFPGARRIWLVGHGTPRHGDSTRALAAHAALLRRRFPRQRLELLWLEQEPSLEGAVAALEPAAEVVVVGGFVDAGPHGRDDVARLLAPLGARAHYTGPVGTRPEVAALVIAAAGTILRAPV